MSLKFTKKTQSFINLSILITIVVILNLVSQRKYMRLDLTQDKRYTLNQATKNILKNLDDIVFIQVYLEGELPASFRQLKESTYELLNEFRAYGGSKIQFEFINPNINGTIKEKREIIQQLVQKGLMPINLQVKEADQNIEKIIFPDALITYKSKTLPLHLLKQQVGVNPEQVLHNSVTALEYGFINTINKLQHDERKKIAYLEGHGELTEKETSDFYQVVSHFYDIERLKLSDYKVGVLKKYDAIIVAQPDTAFSELDKFKIDQFVMKGGKAIWLMNKLIASNDSLIKRNWFLTADYQLNLDDILFKYGVRINNNLIADMQSHMIRVLVDNNGKPQQDFRKWPFHPLVIPRSDHPIVNNLNAIWFRFPNSIDTVGSKKIKKTVILKSSPNSKIIFNPARVSMEEAYRPNKMTFRSGQQIMAVLLEGEFPSVFQNRISPKTLESGDYGDIKTKSVPNKMIVIADGNIIKNQISRTTGQIYPMGYDRFTQQTFGNTNFIMNSLDFLLDDSGIMVLRAKDFKLRLLNKAKIKEEKLKWQIINMIIPILFIILFGIIFNFVRKRRFS